MTKFQRFLLQLPPVQLFHRFAKHAYPPGFQGLSLLTVLRFLFKEIRVHKLNVRGAAVTYNFLMAIPPTMLFLCSLIPYMPVKNLQLSILNILHLITPNDHSYQTVSTIIIDFLNKQHRDVLSFGILSTLFFSSNGMMGLMRSFDRGIPVYKKRTALKRRWTAIKLTMFVLVIAIAIIAALVVQITEINQYLLKFYHNVQFLKLVSVLIIVLLIFLAICFIYTYGPSLSRRFSFISPGSVFATFVCTLLTFVFFFLVNHVIHYSKVYGSIGSLMAFMVWLFLNTQVILLGFEVNVSILLAKTELSNDEIVA